MEEFLALKLLKEILSSSSHSLRANLKITIQDKFHCFFFFLT